MTATESDRAVYLAEIDRLKADYARACQRIGTLTEERDMERAKRIAAETKLAEGRSQVVGMLHAALRISRTA